MPRRCLIVGLDCIGPEILRIDVSCNLPNLHCLVERGVAGPLKSTVPPITVPAWTSMLTGRDPGELGVYGFRNRRSFAYGDLVYASSSVRHPRVWDYVGKAGGHSIVVGVPQTWPPPPINGVLVSGFEALKRGKEGTAFTWPEAVSGEVKAITDEYIFDVEDFRNCPRELVLRQIYEMTGKRFRLMEHFLTTRPWDFAILCEIGSDRVHHCFWSHHDPTHPRHDAASPYRAAIRQYYEFLDDGLNRLVAAAGEDAAVLVVSDHGAQPMYGGVCINDVLREHGWLYLKDAPRTQVPLAPEMVDWRKTRAWGDGGYYGRIFLNIEGREPCGTIPAKCRDDARHELSALLAKVQLDGKGLLENEVVWPENAYRRVLGIAPDLLVFFGGLKWRSIGSVGHERNWLAGNDTGVDEANHSSWGFYTLSAAGCPNGIRRPASILDIAPTVLSLMGLKVPSDLLGRNLMADLRTIS